jgi:hypothetical protein
MPRADIYEEWDREQLKSECVRLLELCYDIADTVMTDCRQWTDPPDYKGILDDIYVKAWEGYAPDAPDE